MKIEKITENKIRIVVNIEELRKNNVDLEDFMMNNIESQKFFLDMLNKAEKEVGFKTKDCRLLIETFSSPDEIFVFTITKFSGSKSDKDANIPADIASSIASNLASKFIPKTKHSVQKTRPILKNSKKKPILKNPIYQFSSFEEFCNLCKVLEESKISLTGIAKKVSLYSYDNTYFLIIENLNLSYKDLKKLFYILSEFACAVRKSRNFESHLTEYGQPIMKQNAFKTGVKYFV